MDWADSKNRGIAVVDFQIVGTLENVWTVNTTYIAPSIQIRYTLSKRRYYSDQWALKSGAKLVIVICSALPGKEFINQVENTCWQ